MEDGHETWADTIGMADLSADDKLSVGEVARMTRVKLNLPQAAIDIGALRAWMAAVDADADKFVDADELGQFMTRQGHVLGGSGP